MSNFINAFKALADARDGAGHQFEKTYNPAANYGLKGPARDITFWDKPAAFRTENPLLQALNPNAFRSHDDKRPDFDPAPKVGSLLGKGG